METLTPPQLTLPDMICFALYSANHAMQRVYQPLLAPLGLTYPQFLVLMTLWQADGRTVGELGRALGLESNTLTPLLKRMESQGFLCRARDSNDERQVRVTLTDKGRGLQEQSAGIATCIFDACGLEVERLTALRDQITALRDRLAG
jgi:DNA-binding MarR family transcriptional regulator